MAWASSNNVEDFKLLMIYQINLPKDICRLIYLAIRVDIIKPYIHRLWVFDTFKFLGLISAAFMFQ